MPRAGRRPWRRIRRSGCAAVLGLAVSVSGCSSTGARPLPAVLEPALPERLSIPAIELDRIRVEQLGLTREGRIQPPPFDQGDERVGWYRSGPTPGERGAAVIVGHVDTPDSAGVFYRLGELEPGDLISIRRSDGEFAAFHVKAVREYRRNAFPTRKVYGPIDHAGLRLITCAGRYDRRSRQYDKNLVVYATLDSTGGVAPAV